MELTNEFTVPVPVDRAWEVLNDVELIAPCMPGAQLQEIEGDEYRGTVKVKVGPITAQYKGAAVFQEQNESDRKIVLKAEGRDTRGQGSASALITATMTPKGESTDVVVHTDLTIKGKVAQFGRGMIADVSAKLLTEFSDCLEGKLEEEPAPKEAVPGADTAQGGGPAPVETTGDPAAEAAKQQAEAPAPTEDVPGATAVQGGGPAPKATPGDPAAEAAKEQAKTGAASGVRKVDAPEAKPVDLFGTAGAPLAKRLVPVIVVLILLLLMGKRRSAKRG